MKQPIAAFTGTKGNQKFSEFLKALRDDQYHAVARGIALQLVALDPDDSNFDDSISSQSESIKENLQEYLWSIRKKDKELQAKREEVAEIIAVIEKICDQRDDNHYHTLYGPDQALREELLLELFSDSDREKPLLKAVEKQVRRDLSGLDGIILAAKTLQAQVERLEADNQEISLALIEVGTSVKLRAPQLLFEDVAAKASGSGGNELIARAMEVLNVASIGGERRSTTPPPQVSAVLLSAPAALLGSPSKSPSKAGSALNSGLKAIERSSTSGQAIVGQAADLRSHYLSIFSGM